MNDTHLTTRTESGSYEAQDHKKIESDG
jgi:hypothetical protein